MKSPERKKYGGDYKMSMSIKEWNSLYKEGKKSCQEKAEFAISVDFLTWYIQIPLDVRKKIPESLNRIRKNPTASELHYEKLEGGAEQNISLLEVYQNYWAVVALEEKTGTCVLLWMDLHDEARRWAENRHCKVNPTTGILQVYLQVHVNGNAGTATGNPGEDMFSDVNDEELLFLGVPGRQIPFVHTLKDRLELYGAADILPLDAYENLSWIAEGKSKDKVIRQATEWQRNRTSSGRLSEALDLPASRKYFAVMKSGRDIARFLKMPYDDCRWCFFLHPAQRQTAEEKYSGSAMVQGEAGTGKTVTAVHRARNLASRRRKTRKILFATFSAGTAENIREKLKKICTATEFQKIEVADLNTWAVRFLQEKGCREETENADMNKCVSLLTPSDCYDHVIVDEGEKFSGEAYRLVRALAGEPHPDDIFIVWDSSRGDNGVPLVLSESGIQIDRRSRTLKVNLATMIGWEDLRSYLRKYPAWFEKEEDSRMWWVVQPEVEGPMRFSFDRKKIYNYWPDYPWNLTAEEKVIFDEENPFWAEFRSEEKDAEVQRISE